MRDGEERHAAGRREDGGSGTHANPHIPSIARACVESNPVKARLVGINHVALEVGNVEEALDFYGRIFELELRGRGGRTAFVDMGDQFLALAEGRRQPPDDHRHFGLVVDDVERTLEAAQEAGAEVRGNDFRDPWGNNVQVVAYEDVQYTKTPAILRAMELELRKTEVARNEITRKLGPDAAS
jgi:predicted enzyme related to lactoylglutathione lyase